MEEWIQWLILNRVIFRFQKVGVFFRVLQSPVESLQPVGMNWSVLGKMWRHQQTYPYMQGIAQVCSLGIYANMLVRGLKFGGQDVEAKKKGSTQMYVISNFRSHPKVPQYNFRFDTRNE